MKMKGETMIPPGYSILAEETHKGLGKVRVVKRGVAPLGTSNSDLRRFFRSEDVPEADEVTMFLWSMPEFVGTRSYDVAVMTRKRPGCRPIITRAQGNGRR